MMTNMKEEQHVIVCQHRQRFDEGVFYTLEAIRWVPSHVQDEIDHRHFESLELADQWAEDLNKVTLSELKKTL